MGINFGTIGNTESNQEIQEVRTSSGEITLDLNKGAMLDLTKREPGLKHIILAAGWDVSATVPAFDLDITAFLLNSNKKINSAADIVYFNNKSVSGLTLSGDNRTGDGKGDDETITINLEEIPSQYDSIEFVVNIFEAMERRQTFGMVNNSYVRLLDKDNNDRELCRFRLKDEYSSSTAVIFARLKRDGSEWNFETIGEGKIVKDLNDIAALYM